MPGDLGDWFIRVIGGGLFQTAFFLFCIALPFALLTMLLHWLERQIQQPLVRRFGWRSVLWTGWLGTPVHELSHILMCKIFAHRVEEFALFQPDRKAGRLGYVKHSFNRKNVFQVIGNFFIGLAPLAGGTLVLFLLLALFYPSAAGRAVDATGISESLASGNLIEAARSFGELAIRVLQHIATIEHVASWRFWLFLYLTLCVGSHMAPSTDDYRGAMTGGVLVLVLLFVVNVVLMMAGQSSHGLVTRVATVFGPALALFSLCAILCTFVALLIFLVTSLLDLALGRY